MYLCSTQVFKILALIVVLAQAVRFSIEELHEKVGRLDGGRLHLLEPEHTANVTEDAAKGTEDSSCDLEAFRTVGCGGSNCCDAMAMAGMTAAAVAGKVKGCEAYDIAHECTGLSSDDWIEIEGDVSNLAAREMSPISQRSAVTLASKRDAYLYAGALKPLVSMLSDDNGKELAAEVIQKLAYSMGKYQFQYGMAREEGLLEGLVEMLKGPKITGSKVRATAARAIRNLAYNNPVMSGNLLRLVTPPLVALMTHDSTTQEREQAAGAMRNMAFKARKDDSLFMAELAIEGLVKAQADPNDKVREQATGALWQLALGNEANKQAIEDAGGELKEDT